VSRHPDILDIDALRLCEGRPADAEHVRNCAECRKIIEELVVLAAAMKEAAGPTPVIPPELEQRILWQARKQALAVRRSPYEIWRRNRWIAAAAVVVVTAVSIVGIELKGPRLDVARRSAVQRVAANAPREQSLATLHATADLDRDGRVDILDAFVLARAVGGHGRDAYAAGGEGKEAHALRGDGAARGTDAAALRTSGDVNGDGNIDQRDVDAIAFRAVALGDA
jgi:hypothetical protein